MTKWWDDDPSEVFFLEMTDRADVGVDLNAPQGDHGGKPHHSYALVSRVHPPDVVLHYEKTAGAITSWSRVIGTAFESEVVWVSHGSRARLAGERPFLRPGWRVPLDGPFALSEPVTLQEMRARKAEIIAVFDELQARMSGSLHTPFERSEKRPLRMVQGYLAKLPRQFLRLFEPLNEVIARVDQNTYSSSIAAPVRRTRGSGQLYVVADDSAKSAQREPFTVDPDVVDRGNRAHARTQNALAQWLTDRDLKPLSPADGDPRYDAACRVNDKLLVAEVKSLTEFNEERQLRLGLGQLLRYTHLLRSTTTVIPALVTERAPTDSSWSELCSAYGIHVTWPPDFPGLVERLELAAFDA